MNLKQLGYFIAVAEELHFGRAAERLAMAQPPLSRQIRQLEDDIGVRLFERGRSAISLTQAGERLYQRASEIMRAVDDARLEARRIGQGAEGRLRVAFVGSSTYGIVPTIIKSFRANYPDVALSLIPMNNAGLHRALIRREIDVAIARPGLADAEFVTRKLIDEALVLAAPDRLGRRAAVDLRDLGDMALIFYPEFPRPSFADFVLDQCRAQGVEVANRVFTQDLQTALALVAIGEGACIVPEPVGHAARNGVQFLRIVPPLATTALSISHRLDERSVHVQNFARIAQAVSRRTL